MVKFQAAFRALPGKNIPRDHCQAGHRSAFLGGARVEFPKRAKCPADMLKSGNIVVENGHCSTTAP